MKPIRTAIVAYGYSARTFHLPLMGACRDFELLAFVERSGPKSAEMWPGTRSYTSLDSLLDSDKPELLVITSPNNTHFPLTRQALLAGCNVLVEKPLSITAAEAHELSRLAKERGLVLCVFHNRRWDNDFLTLKSVIDSGSLGRIVQFESRIDRWNPGIRAKAWKESGEEGSQIIDDLGSHLIDQVLVQFGKPKAIDAWFGVQREKSRSQDSFSLRMEYDSMVAELKAGMLWRQNMPRFAVTGTRGTALIQGNDPQETRLKEVAAMTVGAGRIGDIGLPAADQTASLHDEQGLRPLAIASGTYLDFYPALAASIRGKGLVPVSADEAAVVIEIIDAARKSHAEGRHILLD